MASRYSYAKVEQTNPTFLPQYGGMFGSQTLYNSTNKTLFITAPYDGFDETNTNWMSNGSGSVYVYLYNEATRATTLVQKICQPNVNTNGIASKRHDSAQFGYEIDTFGEWLIIGCPGDRYTEEMDGSDPKRNDSYEYGQHYGSTRTVFTAAAGSVYFYLWNGTTYDYVNKVRPPLFQDFGAEVIGSLFPYGIDDTYNHFGLITGNASAFGKSVCIDKSGYTTLTSTNLGTKKLVAIGAPEATGLPEFVSQEYKGPYGGVWLAHYNSSSGHWELLSSKINSHSFGGNIFYSGGQYQNFNQSSDPLGINHMRSSYDVYDTPNYYLLPDTSSYSKDAQRNQFGLRVSLEYYGNYKLAVYAEDFARIEDNFGQFARGGNTYFYDLIYRPANPNEYAFEMINPYGDRQFYTAIDMNSTTSLSAQYSESVLGYSTFCDANALPDNTARTEWGIQYSDNTYRGSAGYCPFPAIAGSSLANSSGTQYTNDPRLIKRDAVGKYDIKQRGRLLFVSAPGMMRTSNKLFPVSTSQYTTAYSSNHSRKANSVEQCGCLLVFDTDNLSNLKNKGWVLPAPNTWSVGSSFTWTGGFGDRFDIYQESATQWLIIVPYIVEASKTYTHSGSNASDYLYTVNTGRVKTDMYRITYDGTNMSMVLVQTIDGRSVNGNPNWSGYPSFNNDISLIQNAVSGGSSGSSVVAKASYSMRRMSVLAPFISPAIIKNATHNEYHVAEGWANDNDGRTPNGRTGSYHLTAVQGYEINGSAFLQFCE